MVGRVHLRSVGEYAYPLLTSVASCYAAVPVLIDDQIAGYEGLVRATAARYVGKVEAMDFDDICSVLRIKVWQALVKFDPAKCRTNEEGFVFMCVRNRCKDLVKRQKPERWWL